MIDYHLPLLNTSEAVLVMSEDLRLEFANPAALRMMGFEGTAPTDISLRHMLDDRSAALASTIENHLVVEGHWNGDIWLRRTDAGSLATPRAEDVGAGLRDALAFLAHEINSPLSLIQGYTHALTHRLGIFATLPPPRDAVKQALEAAERNAERCQSLVTWVAQTAQNACAHRDDPPSAASESLRALLHRYPFAGEERSWVSIHVEHDFPLPPRGGLLTMVFFTLTRAALNALPGAAQPRLRITVGLHEGTHCIHFWHNGRCPSTDALDALPPGRAPSSGSQGTTGLTFCQRVMRSMQGELQMGLATGEGTAALLRFRSVEHGAPTPLSDAKRATNPIEPRKRDLALRLSP